MKLEFRPGRLLLIALGLAGALLAAHAQGGPPMLTDDPGTPGDGHWEINTAVTTERRAGEHSLELPLLDLNYGVGDRLQLKYEVAWVRLSNETGTHAGFSNSLAGVKWRFHDAGPNTWQISTYPQIEFHNPGSRSDERGLAGPGTSWLLPLEIMRDFGSFSVNADFGYVTQGTRDREWFGGIIFGRKLAPGIELAAELRGAAAAHPSENEVIANLGGRIDLSEDRTLLISVGRELHNAHEPRTTLIAYLGLQVRR